jgi:hypothetical protein
MIHAHFGVRTLACCLLEDLEKCFEAVLKTRVHKARYSSQEAAGSGFNLGSPKAAIGQALQIHRESSHQNC